MARAGLGWSVAELGDRSGISPRSILRFEAGEKVKLETVETLRSALVQGGALFVDIEGRSGVTVKA